MMCSRCKMTFYCSTRCQKQHWKAGGHKQHCVAVADRRVAGDGGGLASGGGGGTAAAEEDGCAICLGALSQSPSQTLPCTHVYHRECVEKLRSFGISQACPMCRAELPPGPEKLHDDAMRRWFVLHQRYGQGDDKPWRRVSNDGDRRELAEVMRMMHEAAEQGYAEAHCNLGTMYVNGQGVDQSDSTALKWYRKAAEQGHAQAQFNLGIMYDNGQGVDQSHTTAAKWYRKAAEQGNADAQYNLGAMYENGQGVGQSDATAAKWYRKAAEQGYAQAQLNLGVMYANGQGVDQSHATAAKWYRKAAEQGDAQAQVNLGIMYENGEGVGQSDATAAKWYRKAAEQGYAQAQLNLGVMYGQGKGVDQNISEALRWFRNAEAAGDPLAAGAIQKTLQLLRQQQQQAAGETSASSPSSSPTLPSIPIGARVELRGLQAKPELNGRRGVVVKFIGSSGRYRVQLDEEGGGEAFSLKAENLLVA